MALVEMKQLDEILRCGICYEYITTAMMTHCSHNYCSLCIRRYMTYKSQCPTCFCETSEPLLRNNRVLDELIIINKVLQDKVKKLLGSQVKSLSSSTNNESVSLKSGKTDNVYVTPKKVSAGVKGLVTPEPEQPTRLTVNFSPVITLDSSGEDSTDSFSICKKSTSEKHVEINSKEVPSSTATQQNHMNESATASVIPPTVVEEGKVPCPVCTVHVLERNINQHLDACLKRQEQEPQIKTLSKRIPLPKLVYYLLGDKDLKKRLKNWGLSTIGDRKQLASRLQKFTTLYNAECDAAEPREVTLLVHQIEKEEQEEKKAAVKPTNKVHIDRKSDEKTVEEYRENYLQKNDKHFQKLITQMKAKKHNHGKTVSQQSPSTSASSSRSLFNTNDRTIKHDTICDSNNDYVAYSDGDSNDFIQPAQNLFRTRRVIHSSCSDNSDVEVTSFKNSDKVFLNENSSDTLHLEGSEILHSLDSPPLLEQNEHELYKERSNSPSICSSTSSVESDGDGFSALKNVNLDASKSEQDGFSPLEYSDQDDLLSNEPELFSSLEKSKDNENSCSPSMLSNPSFHISNEPCSSPSSKLQSDYPVNSKSKKSSSDLMRSPIITRNRKRSCKQVDVEPELRNSSSPVLSGRKSLSKRLAK